jgi:hypothetical protein
MGRGGGAQVEALNACVAFCCTASSAAVRLWLLDARRLLQREGGQALSQRSKEQPWGHQVAA